MPIIVGIFTIKYEHNSFITSDIVFYTSYFILEQNLHTSHTTFGRNAAYVGKT